MTSQKAISSSRIKLLKLLITSGTTGVFMMAAFAMIYFGTHVIAEKAKANENFDALPVTHVTTRLISYSDKYNVARKFVGHVQSQRSTELSFEFGGTITDVYVDIGDQVMKGDVIAKVDTRLLETNTRRLTASRQALIAQSNLLKQDNFRKIALSKNGIVSNSVVEQSGFDLSQVQARLAEIDADLEANRVRIEKAAIKAPFSGQVSSRFLNEGSSAGSGQSVVRLLKDMAPLFRVGLDPALAASLEKTRIYKISVGNKILTANLASISPNIDPSTQTLTVKFQFEERSIQGNALFGQTGILTLQQSIDQRGAWVPISSLQGGSSGIWKVMTAQSNNAGNTTVVPEAVEIIFADERQAYVKGSFPNQTQLISDGVHRVVPGQTISISNGI